MVVQILEIWYLSMAVKHETNIQNLYKLIPTLNMNGLNI